MSAIFMSQNGENKPPSPVLITPAKMMPSTHYDINVVVVCILDIIHDNSPLRSLQ